MAENSLKAQPLLSHCHSSGLAESDAVSLAGSFKDDLIALFLHAEVVARNRVPAEAAIVSSRVDSSELCSAAASRAEIRLDQRTGWERQYSHWTE